jgi:periplasmic protein CpxP/Spy
MTVNLTNMFKKRIATLKAMPLLAVAVTLAIAAGTLAPALAQSFATPTTHARKQDGQNKLNLTADQKAQFKSIRESSKAQIEAILTPSQKEQLAAAKGDWKQRRQVWKSLNLTPDQKASIKQIRSAAKQQMAALLSPEQLQQWQQKRQHHKNSAETSNQ